MRLLFSFGSCCDRSGRARNGPLHYKPALDGSIRGLNRSRNSSVRGGRSSLTLPESPYGCRRSLEGSIGSQMERAISDIVVVDELVSCGQKNGKLHQDLEDSGMQRRFSSSPKRNVAPSKPLPIRGYEVRNTMPSRKSSRRNKKVDHGVLEKEPRVRNGKALVEKSVDEAKSKTNMKACSNAGGLTQALSRESSIRNGHECFLGVDEDCLPRSPSPSRASWGRRIRQFPTDVQCDHLPKESSSNGKACASCEKVSHVPNMNDVKKELESLEPGSDTHSETNDEDAENVIIADPSLASEWHKIGPVEASSAPCLSKTKKPSSVISESKSLEKNRSQAAVGTAPSLVSPPNLPNENGRFSRNSSTVDFDQEYLEQDSLQDRDAWNAQFLKRWKNVKHRARLQAVGVRGIWKFNSPSSKDKHRTPELLVNELPDSDNTARDSSSVPSKKDSYETTNNSINDVADNLQLAEDDSKPSEKKDSQVNRDPSLATLLLGEVAEVC